MRPPLHSSSTATRVGRAALLACALLGTSSCGPAESDPDRSSAADRDTDRDTDRDPASRSLPPTKSRDETLRTLAELGYAGFSDSESARAPGAGVVEHDVAQAWRGYNLVTSIPGANATLFDNDGRVVHRWATGWDSWTRARLLPDGDLLVIGQTGEGWNLVRLDWDGREVWPAPVPAAHHDLCVLPDGRLLTLTRSIRSDTAYAPGFGVRDNQLVIVALDTGEVLRSISLIDVLGSDPGVTLLGPDDVPSGGNRVLDPLHFNSVFFIADDRPARHDARFAAGRVLLSSRHQSALYLLDLETLEVAWHWGPGELQYQHEASVLSDGRVLLFDNGSEARGYSRLLEVDPLDGSIVWSYTATPPESFFSSGRGTVQSLPGGNRLVGSSVDGAAFEVTRAGERVWRFLNPETDETGAHGALRIERYAPEFVEPLLERR